MPGKKEWLATRTSLLARLKGYGDSGWEGFCDVYGKIIYSVAYKAGLKHEDSQDVVQETMLRLARLMPGFTYDRSKGSFKSWVLTIARSRIVDCMRKRARERRFNPQTGTSGTSFVSRIPDQQSPDVEALFEMEWQTQLMEVAMERVRERISPRNYQIFDLHVRQEWPVKKLVSTMGVTANQVYLAKLRVSEAIRLEVQRLEKSGPSPSD